MMIFSRFLMAALFLPFCAAGGFKAVEAAEPSRPLSSLEETASTPAVTEVGESELVRLLTTTLQEESVREKGELELRLLRPWSTIRIPTDTVTLKVLDMPTAGVTPQFIVRFELQTGGTNHGPYQAVVQGRVWREVQVAKNPLPRGHTLAESDLEVARRDVLTIRSELAEDLLPGIEYQLKEPVPAGAPLLARTVKPKPVVRRGQVVEAFLSEGAMRITMKVEVLEDGIPGQIVRLKNLTTRREFRGVVENENRIVVPL